MQSVRGAGTRGCLNVKEGAACPAERQQRPLLQPEPPTPGIHLANSTSAHVLPTQVRKQKE